MNIFILDKNPKIAAEYHTYDTAEMEAAIAEAQAASQQ